jgi:alpha-galactosidase
VTAHRPAFRPEEASLSAAGIVLSDLCPLIDGAPLAFAAPRVDAMEDGWTITWPIQHGPGSRFVLTIALQDPSSGAAAGALRLDASLEEAAGATIESIGLRIGRAAPVLRYLRNGYTSWDGSYFLELDSARGVVTAETGALTGHAVTALVARDGAAAVLGFLRHDRFQSRFRFAFDGPLTLDVETLIDQTPCGERIAAEPLLLLAGPVEDTLRAWARAVAAESPKRPRVRSKRISGWCSWYNLYASISEASILEHLRAAANFRDRHGVELEVFQIDDGFTPEMGDWLEVKPQFPRGLVPLLDDIRAAGFTPGLWIAPLMVGNRSRLYAEHPDWVVRDRANGLPLAPMKFYGEFRWHKRSEEYYVLDITHPQAEAYMRKVFRTWRRDWGCSYFKTDFMHFGCEYGPKQARRHRDGLSRIEVWMRMVRLIREEIGDALWLASGSPIWAPIGWVDAVRIGRDIGVSWRGRYSAESLLRDQAARNFGNGVFWQADPDCILLRERFHDLTDDEVRSLALFAGLAGGVLMTSDQLDEVSDARGRLFASLARSTEARPCDYPRLGRDTLRHRIGVGHLGQPVVISAGDPVLVQRVRQADGAVLIHVFNTGDQEEDRLIEPQLAQHGVAALVKVLDCEQNWRTSEAGVHVRLRPHASCRLLFPAPVS